MTQVQLLGVPYNIGGREETAYAIDQHNGPRALRAAMADMHGGYNIPLDFEDLGDLHCQNSVEAVLAAVDKRVSEFLSQKEIFCLLGGAHTITLGTLRALSRAHSDFSVIYFDAHPDLMPHKDILYGSSMFHAIKEQVLKPEQLALIGVRQIELPESEVIAKHKIFYRDGLDFERKTAVEILSEIRAQFKPPYFLSIDLDAIDPGIAPGVTSPFPGGLTPRELLFLATELAKERVLGFEIVELCPVRDFDSRTACIGASLLQAISTTIARH